MTSLYTAGGKRAWLGVWAFGMGDMKVLINYGTIVESHMLFIVISYSQLAFELY